jgi:type IV pilus assembly protein PilW
MTTRIGSRQIGFTIVELMIAMTLGLLILAGLTSVVVSNIQTRNEIERANQQIENGRYAMELLTDDLHNAGYLAEFDPGPLTTPATNPDPCLTTLAALSAALPIAVQGYDNPNTVPTCLSDVMTGTDILVIRHASTCAVGEANCEAEVSGVPYFQASACSNTTELSSAAVTSYYALDTVTGNLTRHKKNCTTLATYRRYRTHIYFIASNDISGDGIPTLKRAELGPTGFTIVPLVQGIQNLQIEYGIDTTGATGTPAVFNAAPDSYNGCTGVTCVGYWRNTVAAKVNLLARNTTITVGYLDNKTYSLGLKTDGTANTVGPFNDAYKRHVYESVVLLKNVAGRITP